MKLTICLFLRKMKMVYFEEDIVNFFAVLVFFDKYIFLMNEKKKLDRTLINGCFYELFYHTFHNLHSKKSIFLCNCMKYIMSATTDCITLCLFHQW